MRNPSDASSACSVSDPPSRGWLAAVLGLYAALAFVQVFWGRFTGDEGFYALAARSVMHGMKPYRDFLFMQMPALPYFYAGWFALFGVGIESGRIFSALLGLAAVGFVALACERRAGRVAGIVAGALMAGNLSYVFDAAIIKTQPLTVFLTAAAIFVLAERNPRSQLRSAALAMALMSLAFLARLSLVPVLPLLWVYLGWRCRKSIRRYLVLLTANLRILGAACAWFYSGGNMFFGVYRFHSEFFGYPKWSLAWFLGFVRGWLANELLIVVLVVCAAVALVRGSFLRARVEPDDSKVVPSSEETRRSVAPSFEWFLLLAYGAVTAVHTINVYSYPTHQTSIMPFAAAFAAIGLRRPLEAAWNYRMGLGKIALAAALCAGMPMQEWEVNFYGDGSLGRLRDAAALISKNSRPGDAVLSFYAELGVASNREVPRGYELSEYTYFPEMTDDRRRKLKTVNFAEVIADLRSQKARIVCWAPHGVDSLVRGSAVAESEFDAALYANYKPVGAVENYGQFDELLFVYRAIDNPSPAR